MAASSALAITLVTLLGGIGALPTGGRAEAASGSSGTGPVATLATVRVPDTEPTPDSTPNSTTTQTPTQTPTRTPPPATTEERPSGEALPDDSGTGRRVVFDISAQRVWLADPEADDPEADDGVLRTYLVSGSLTDNLAAGSYEVYSRSRWAVGISDSGVMEYFVRFTRGANAAIGFHGIPTKDGRPLQTRAQLGTPQSHGCIRQALPDAKALWDFAPVGTTVVVVN